MKNISIKGMAGCVPARVEENKDYPGITQEEIQKYRDAPKVPSYLEKWFE